MTKISDAQLEDQAAQVDQDRRKAALAAYIEHFGLPPDVSRGSNLERFNPDELAAALESEIGRAHIHGWKKIEIKMDLLDAFLLSQHLRTR